MTRVEQRLVELSRRRAQLVARGAAQRAELGGVSQAWHLPLAMVDRGVAVWRYLRVHPALLAGLSVAFAVARPRRAARWLGRGWSLWRFFRGMTVGQGKPY